MVPRIWPVRALRGAGQEPSEAWRGRGTKFLGLEELSKFLGSSGRSGGLWAWIWAGCKVGEGGGRVVGVEKLFVAGVVDCPICKEAVKCRLLVWRERVEGYELTCGCTLSTDEWRFCVVGRRRWLTRRELVEQEMREEMARWKSSGYKIE